MSGQVVLPSDVDRLVNNSIDVHCHGVGRFDFTEIPEIELQEIEDILQFRKHKSILTLYLPEKSFNDFLVLMDSFAKGKQAGKFKHIAGVALEGPLLSSFGGTPRTTLWSPSKAQWRQLAECGKKGLVYVILSPDAPLDKFVSTSESSPAHSVIWIAETLLHGGVLPAAGHFLNDNPLQSAKRLQEIFDVVAAWGQGPTVTDHLYNDMPLNFKHAWRTFVEKEVRDKEVRELDINSWSLGNLDEKLGVVPATIIRNATKGLVKISQNFDGEHVDLAIVKKTVEMVGSECMMMMTDSIESKVLAGRHLHAYKNSTLLYQEDNIVAAGSQNVRQQIENMLSIGLSQQEIRKITCKTPEIVLLKQQEYARGFAKASCF